MSYEPIPELIPAELRELNQWVCWRFEERNGKETKIPINATTGHEADCTDRREFASFNAAMQRFKKYNNLDGVGFVFHDEFEAKIIPSLPMATITSNPPSSIVGTIAFGPDNESSSNTG